MLRLVKLEIEGFRSFETKTSINFPTKGAVLIKGKYSDSNMSSGSGKSSILMAISFALGFCNLSSTELKNWNSKKLHVSLTLTDGENTYTIVRSPKLKLFINDKEYESTASGSEQKLKEILKADLNRVEILVNRSQRERGKFINWTDSEKKEFLAPILGLDRIENALDQFAAELLHLENEKNALMSKIETFEQVVKNSNFTDDDLVKAKNNLEKINAEYQDAKSKSDTSSLKEELVKYKLDYDKLVKLENQVSMANAEKENIKKSILNDRNMIDELKKNVCPTCKREWENSGNKILELEKQISSNAQKIKEIMSFIENAKIALLNKPHINEKIMQLNTEIQNRVSILQPLSSALASAESYFNQLLNKKNELQKIDNSLKELREKLSVIEKDILVTKTSTEILGRNGFLGAIFDEILLEIESRINSMLSDIPNVSGFTVSILSSSVTKSGNVKKGITTKIYKDGNEISIKNLSGGQMCAMELCADLAVRETIISRCGSNFGWIALDEALDGLDNENKVCALNLIKSKINGLILIIDHSTEIKEGFEKIIEVEFDGKRSVVVS